jgi:hypothetical protein
MCTLICERLSSILFAGPEVRIEDCVRAPGHRLPSRSFSPCLSLPERPVLPVRPGRPPRLGSWVPPFGASWGAERSRSRCLSESGVVPRSLAQQAHGSDETEPRRTEADSRRLGFPLRAGAHWSSSWVVILHRARSCGLPRGVQPRTPPLDGGAPDGGRGVVVVVAVGLPFGTHRCLARGAREATPRNESVTPAQHEL